MSEPIKHHFVPQFYINNWGTIKRVGKKEVTVVDIFLKAKAHWAPQAVQAKDICFEKHLYSTVDAKGEVSAEVEKGFFSKIDGNAAHTLKVLVGNGTNNLSTAHRENFAYFIDTLMLRSKEYIEGMRKFNESSRERAQKLVNEQNKGRDKDLRGEFLKKQFDDSPKILEFHSKGKIYKEILAAEWKVVDNTTSKYFLTSDLPLIVLNLDGNSGYIIDELPKQFLIILPLSPSKCLIMSNRREVNASISQDLKGFVEMTNNYIIQNANEIIISKYKIPEQYILRRII